MADGRQRIIAVVQARMSSRRLPGKVLTEVAGKPLLQYLCERLHRCRELETTVVATSDAVSDDPVQVFADSREIPCYRGPLEDVASRMLAAARAEQCAAFVRISGDSPLMDPALVDNAVALFRDRQPDLVSNVLVRSFPRGQSVEVISLSAMERAVAGMSAEEEREHVTPFFYAHPDAFRIVGLQSNQPDAEMRLCVDTETDLARFADIVARLGEPHWESDLNTVMAAARAADSALARERGVS